MRTDGPTASSAPAPGGIRSALDRLSLRSLLLGSAGLVVLFCALVVFLVELNSNHAFRLVDTLIYVEDVIADDCLSSATAMSDARRQEKDFALNYQEFGFDETRSRYITRLLTDLTDIREKMAGIRSLAGDPETARMTLEVESALERYRAGVETWVEKHVERGVDDVGVHGNMRSEALAIERAIAGLGSDTLLARLLAARLWERNYLERQKDADAANVERAVDAFRAAVTAAHLPAAAKAELDQRAGRYLGFFLEYVRLTEEIRDLKREYLRAVQQIDPLLEKLHAASDRRVDVQRSAYVRRTRLQRLPILLGGALALGLTALASFVIAVSVARAVDRSKEFAERVASGDLRSRLAPAGGREFHSLATSLNSMAESLQEAEHGRARQAEALRESEEKYRAFVETSSDWIWAIDRDGRHTYSNRRVREVLGLEPEELPKVSTLELLHPEDLPRVRELLAASVAAGTGWQGAVLRWRHRDGSYRWLESSAVPQFDERGALVGFRGTDRDITQRKRLEEELVKAQKLEAIGTLAGGIAHDFNNLLQGLFGYLSLAKISIDRREQALGMLEQAERALDLSVNLTTQLLTFAKGGKPLRRPVALPVILEDPVKFALSGSRTAYRIDLAADLPTLEADAGQLGQVFQNLALNASEAMPQGGTVEIAARTVTIAPGSNPLVPAGGTFVRIDVRDSGVGIPGKHLARIFDPYFTTKQRGSGLGLATSYSIVRNHDGFIDVTSSPGAGSVFSVYLPAGAGGTAPEPRAAARTGSTTRKVNVLVMDDEELVRGVAASLIAALGHTATTVANGEEALEAFRRAREQGRPFDVVILDLTVKNGMGGEEAIRGLLELDPLVKAVVSSGYSDSDVVANYRSHGFVGYLNKPYRLDALDECLLALAGPADQPSD